MSKRHIAYIKPEEPNFLKRLKQQIGYKEGPTVDTKFEDLGPAENLSDTEDDQPQIVVLKEGDLTAEQAALEKAKLEREAAETPADLSTRILFKQPNKKSTDTLEKKEEESKKALKKNSKKIKKKTLLSFDEEAEEVDN